MFNNEKLSFNRGGKNYGGVRFDRKIGQNLGLPYEIL